MGSHVQEEIKITGSKSHFYASCYVVLFDDLSGRGKSQWACEFTSLGIYCHISSPASLAHPVLAGPRKSMGRGRGKEVVSPVIKAIGVVNQFNIGGICVYVLWRLGQVRESTLM